ncbi:ankyrin repeat domain-containing protein [Leucobacter chromiireducens]|uniref:Ankyrin repeat domain-containing protein n=1 Tax=Leucobacter chromiireducens subsp. solipictus TaxID=398235 RepID=A0ABS1SEM4_9MICO|nr:ankyrin repeat domain-containing protein [Leucobacter chromiireducens]MBL3678512.1 ankyrin repeat domain-containing protein [Leucobacter chromiireducens subsp. solipictus]
MSPFPLSPWPARAPRRVAAVATLLALGPLVLGCAPEPAPPPVAAPSTSAPHMPTEPPAPTTPPAPAPPQLSQAELDDRLREAAWANDVSAAEEFIARGANVNAQDSTMQSAYLIATSEGHTELLRLTLAHGANVADLDSWNGTGLIRAAERGHWAVAGELIRSDVPLDHVNRVGYQAIHEAVWFGRDDPSYHATIRVLAAGGVELDRPSVSEGLTPLQMAEWKGYPGSAAVLQAILQAPAPADPAAALLAAAGSGDANAVAVALRAQADPSSVDADGRSARDIAEAAGHSAAAQVIRALGG